MPRMSETALRGLLHHVTHRRVRSLTIFDDDANRKP